MVKLVVNLTKIVIAVVVALLFGSCNLNIGSLKKVDGDGNVVRKTRTVTSNFTSVKASNGLDVILIYGPSHNIKVEADANLHDHIKTEITDGELKIFTDANLRNAEAKKVYVQLPKLSSLESSSGASVTGKNIFESTSLDISSSSGSEIDIKVKAVSVSCQSSSGSELKISGTADRLETKSSSGSSIDASDLIVANAFADSSSGSSIEINATETLTAEASSGSSVTYEVDPKTLNRKMSSGGSISKD
ncbi:head GIN domain-containing protein [Flavobacterium suncheonense]|uniref:Putative auto-transporter adhesin head GIN domain-containing protein n=1 Tax=Flavobacterium suncheonense GH29-5 = DSM 17707 TaxID=1121899 RepID=A0A0A2MD86_9FLAO|nr:head GIN domain-containing protein [Flavobacterium suncheonense]KGO90224.1 hypothetical protein Q764_03985 [Flavobacterium suncheonense GH29-5 = DSM 17707]